MSKPSIAKSSTTPCLSDIQFCCQIDPESADGNECVIQAQKCETSDGYSFRPTFGEDGNYSGGECFKKEGDENPIIFWTVNFFVSTLLTCCGAAMCLCIRRQMSNNALIAKGFPPDGTYHGLEPLIVSKANRPKPQNKPAPTFHSVGLVDYDNTRNPGLASEDGNFRV